MRPTVCSTHTRSSNMHILYYHNLLLLIGFIQAGPFCFFHPAFDNTYACRVFMLRSVCVYASIMNDVTDRLNNFFFNESAHKY